MSAYKSFDCNSLIIYGEEDSEPKTNWNRFGTHPNDIETARYTQKRVGKLIFGLLHKIFVPDLLRKGGYADSFMTLLRNVIC